MKKLDSKIVSSIVTAIASVAAAVISGVFSYNIAIHQTDLQIEKYQSQISALESQINNQSTNSENKENKPETLSTEITTENPENTKPDERTQVNNNPTEIDEEEEETKSNTPEMIAVDWKSESTYQSYSGNGNNGFKMFGDTYTNGFIMTMGASYNMWGGGTQYVTYNISSVSKEYSLIKLLVGHVDGYASNDIKVELFLDKSLDENSDYEYTISPNVSPQWLSIDITDCSAMTIQVSNLGGDTNCIGFADTRFE